MKLISLIIIAFYCSIGVLYSDITYVNTPTEMLRMTSFTDENGLFSYTFSGGTNDTYRFLNPTIIIDASFINSVESPQGWEATIQPESITWQWTNITDRLVDDTPFTFTVYSSETGSTLNNDGLILGDIHSELPSTPDSVNLVGYNTFSYLQPIPEPSTTVLVSGALVLGLTIRRRML